MNKIILSFAIVFSFATAVIAQNKFEGYNIILDVPETQTGATCAIRYAPPTTSITIADLNPATAMNLRSCDGSATNLVKNSAATFSLKANANDYKWCFQGEDKRYRISFNGDQYSKTVVYDWIATPDEKNLGNYNVKDFGAVGDGKTDDTIAVQSALAFIAVRNGGTLFFPEGDYQVGNTPNFKGLVLPSNITIQGIGGLQSNAGTSDLPRKNPTRINLTVPNRALFRIGECIRAVRRWST